MMRRKKVGEMNAPRLATWLLRQFRPNAAALAGDLLEEMAGGRSQGWYWRQVLRAIVAGTSQEVRTHPYVALRAVATGWIVLLLIFVLCGDLVAEAIAERFWGWKRSVGYSEGYWWPFRVSATIVSYTGFALSAVAVVRLHRLSMVLPYLCSVVAALVGSAAFFDWLARPVGVPHWVFYLVSVSLPYVWRSGLILAPLVILLSGLAGAAVGTRSTNAVDVCEAGP